MIDAQKPIEGPTCLIYMRDTIGPQYAIVLW
jgi:hypothetical protein